MDKAPCNSSGSWWPIRRREVHRDDLPLIAQLQCLLAQPWRQALVYLTEPLRYNPLHEIAVQEPKACGRSLRWTVL